MGLDLLTSIQDQKIEHVYQPMWNLTDRKVFGYEALIRFPDGFCGGNIEKAFEIAREEGCLYDLDTKSISCSVNSFPFHHLDEELLFINIYPSTLLHEQFETFIDHLLERYPYIQGKIVFELSETIEEESLWTIPEFHKRVSVIKEYGFYIALDDIGKGVANFQKIIEFSPNYIKLDRYFARDLNISKEKQRMVSLLIKYSEKKMGLILEGIEEEVDLAQAKKLNVPVVQGYLLGRPQKITKNKLPALAANYS